MKAAERNKFKKLLLEERAQILDEIRTMNTEISEMFPEDGDIVDQAQNSWDRMINLGISESELDKLKEIEEALLRIEDKTYGICVDSGKPISLERLKAIPYAKRTVEMQERFEKSTRGRR